MGSAVQVLLALLASVGGTALVCGALWALRLPAGRTGAVLVLPVRGDGAEAEQAVKSLVLLREWTGFNVPIILADGGLDPAGLGLVRTLMRGRTGLVLCPAEDLGRLLASQAEEESKEG